MATTPIKPTLTPNPQDKPSKYGNDPAQFDAAMQATIDWQHDHWYADQTAALDYVEAAMADTAGKVQASAQSAALADQHRAAAATQAGIATDKAVAASESATLADQHRNAAADQASIASSHKVAAEAAAVQAASAETGAKGAKTAAEAAAANAVAVVTGGTGSLKAAPGKLPMADAVGRIDPTWWAAMQPNVAINSIGIPGTAGFGVGICPAPPAGFVALPGCHDVTSDNYGNYQHTDGSVMCWIPAFYLRLGHASNPTFGAYGVNSVDIKPLSAFPDDATAEASGYYRHRAFFNAGQPQLGFFRDKYDCSLNGNVASSIKNAMPMVSGPAAGQTGFSAATANGQTPTNNYGGAIAAARSRGAKFVPETIFMADALTRITEAHTQASTSTTYCAWYDATGVKSFPKGNNNGALKDFDDTTVTFTSAGVTAYPAFALAGSASNFAKTTHNGQACGVSDVNGNVWKINPGLTCIAAAKTITGATQTNPVALTVTAHGYTTGQVVVVTGVGGMTQLNDKLYTLTVVDEKTITLNGIDGTAYTAYTSGGSATTGTFYSLKTSADVATLTGGNTLATDAWGVNGVAANFEAITLAFNSTPGSNGFVQKYGSGANAVFDWSTAAGRALAMAGMPAAGGVSPAGTNLMGLDYFYQYIRNELCVVSRGSWDYGANAGVRARLLFNYRANATYYVGFAASRYL